MKITRLLAATVLALATAPAPAAQPDHAALLEAGRRIYEVGVLPNGEPVQATREGDLPVSGAGAACMLCHRRSGIGTTEGTSPVPTVTAPALFTKQKPVGHQPRVAPGMTLRELPYRERPSYTDQTLARALRDGVAPDGRAFEFLMPRYTLADADMKALIAYLRTLGATPSPGADARLAHFATVIAPDTNPERRRMMLDVLNACFREQYPEDFHDPAGRVTRGQRLAWRLHVWELEGAPEAWPKQLAAHYKRLPVFALVSGLAGETWAPVHRFCEDERLPCLFANADVPGTPEDAPYNFYFFKGVYLEAEALAIHLDERREALGITRVVQVSRPGTAGAAGAAHLRKQLEGGPLRVEDRPFTADQDKLLGPLGAGDALVLWLREDDLRQLVAVAPSPPGVAGLFVSGTLGGADRPPLPTTWKKDARILYAYDPPLRWRNRMTYNLRPWLEKNGLQAADERLQGNTLTACNFLVTGIATLQGHFFRDHLLEASEIGLEGNQAAPSAFPRFSLGPGQRFGAKGAFVVKFESPDSDRIVRDSEWIVP